MGEPKEEVKLLDEEADAKQQLASKNGKKSDSAGGTSFFTWFMVLALLGVWTSVAVVYFDLVDYQGVIAKAKDLRYNLSEVLQGKLVSYDVDGDGDFDVEDAKVLLDEKPKDALRKREHPFSRDVGLKLREALKQQLSIIHERVEAKKIARMALMEVRNLIAKEEQEKALEQKREEAEVKARDRANAWFKQQGERIEKEEKAMKMEKAMERVRKEKEEAEQEEAKKAKKMEEDEAKEKSEREKKPSGKSSDSEGKKGSKSPKEGKSKKVSKSEKDH